MESKSLIYKFQLAFVQLFMLSIAISGYSQQFQISGTLKNRSSPKPLNNVTVLLKNNFGKIVSYGISNEAGKFRLTIPDTVQNTSCFIEINPIGYKQIRQPYTKLQSIYDFWMEEYTAQLAGVEVKTILPVKKKGDTLSYDVSSFARREDRSIGDVINRMPGMTVANDGQISYNGKNIANLYIHGDDLMDGRYGVATKSITKEMIKSVDVMQNFQPQKVLKDKVLTQDVVVNLVLKDENSVRLAGQAMLGAGLPEQHDIAINAMIFNKTIKTLNSIKGNNSGIDYKNDLNQYGAEDLLSSMDNARPEQLLSAATIDKPVIPLQYYYFNRSGLINTNSLYNSKDSLQVRSNIQVYADRNAFNFISKQENYIIGDTIRYNQMQQVLRQPLAINATFTAQANRSRYFLIDKISFNLTGDNTNSRLNFNNSSFNQQLTGHIYHFSNKFNWIPLLKSKGLLNMRWNIDSYLGSQTLLVDTGLNNRVLNYGKPYLATEQYIRIPVFFSDASVEYIIGGKHLIRSSYEAGVLNEWQQLNSTLTLTQTDNSKNRYQGDAGNHVRWQRNKAYITVTHTMKSNDWEVSVSAPLSWQSIRYYQDDYALDETFRRTYINPHINIKRYVNSEDHFLINYSYSNRFGNISGIYRGVILANYQSLIANDAQLQERVSSSAGIRYNFQRSIILLFINAAIQYNRVTANSILSSVITNNEQRTILLPYANDQSNIHASLGVSKYIFRLKTKFSLNASWRRGYYEQFINAQKLPFINDAFSLHIGIDGKLVNDVTFSYYGLGIWNNSFANTSGIYNSMKLFDHSMGITYAPASRFILNLKARQLYSVRPNLPDMNYWHVDATARYNLKKLRSDLELGLTNLLNTKEYKMVGLSSNQFTFSNYETRGLMLIVRANFSF